MSEPSRRAQGTAATTRAAGAWVAALLAAGPVRCQHQTSAAGLRGKGPASGTRAASHQKQGEPRTRGAVGTDPREHGNSSSLLDSKNRALPVCYLD